MDRHPNFVRIDQLQTEIVRLSEEVAKLLIDKYFDEAVFFGARPNVSELARENGVRQSWLQKRIVADPRYEGMKATFRWQDEMADKNPITELGFGP